VTAKGGGRPAAFLDRDGTIIRDTVYIRDPKDVELLPGAADAIKRLNEQSVVVIVVTNQSGIGRGLLSPEEYEGVRARIDAELAEQGARIDATYMCPHHPEAAGGCDCRKPGLGMYRRAIGDYGLDPRRSLFVGDRWRDVAPSVTLGGFATLLDSPSTPDEEFERASSGGVGIAASLADAVDRYLDALPGLGGRQ
jgi:D-glycero-D-manno-heptose 1,7-bisphosphate phosphatase